MTVKRPNAVPKITATLKVGSENTEVKRAEERSSEKDKAQGKTKTKQTDQNKMRTNAGLNSILSLLIVFLSFMLSPTLG